LLLAGMPESSEVDQTSSADGIDALSSDALIALALNPTDDLTPRPNLTCVE
jgi:hypothetical protein